MVPKIIVIGKYYHPSVGGMEEVTRLLCEDMARKRSVKALVFNHEAGNFQEIIDGVTVARHHVEMTCSSQPLSLSFAISLFRGKWDLIYFHAPNVFASLFLVIRYALFDRRSKLVIFHHMDIYGRPFFSKIARYLYNILIAKAHGVIVTSRKYAAVSRDIKHATRIIEVPLGIDPAHYDVTSQQREQAMEWRRSLAGDAPVVGFVGRHVRYKGLQFLVKALAQMPDVHAFIAGDGPEREPAQALARELGIADRLHFMGHVTQAEKCRILAAIDVFAFPSTEITEAFGIAQIEAMMLGAPVVASDLPTGVTDVSVDGKTALLVPPRNAEALAQGLMRIIEYPALGRELATRAAMRARERFTVTAMAGLNDAFVDQVLASPIPRLRAACG